MITTETCMIISCDTCGSKLEYDDHIAHFVTAADAHDAAAEYEWKLLRNGQAFCKGSCEAKAPACACSDDEDCPDYCKTPGCPCVLHDEIPAGQTDELPLAEASDETA